MPEVNLDCKAPSRQEVEGWLDRIDDVTAAVREILNEDPMEAERRRKEREDRRREVELQERRDKVKMRYDPRYYSRFENDAFIDALLKDAGEPARAGGKAKRFSGDESLYSLAERVSLNEALQMKKEAAAAVAAADWERALRLYSTAIGLDVVDASLQCTLHNNRALVQLKLKRYLEAVEDASYMLREEPTNVKALLRRATALRHLRRPLDALRDAEAALKKDPSSREADELLQWLWRAKREHELCADFQHHHPEDAGHLSEAVGALVAAVSERRREGTDGQSGVKESNATCEESDDKCMIRVSLCVCRCLEITQRFHRGAAVLFSLCNGMRPLMELITDLLSTVGRDYCEILRAHAVKEMLSNEMTLFSSLRLLSLALLGSESCADDLAPAAVSELTNNLSALLLGVFENSPTGIRTVETTAVHSPVVAPLLQVVEALAVRFPIEVHAAYGPVMERVMEGMFQEGPPAPQQLFFFCGALEALLSNQSVAEAMTPTLESIGTRIVEAALASGPVQLKEAGLAMSVRISCIKGACAKSMASRQFTRALALLLPCLSGNVELSLPTRAEEALFAVVYNIFLQEESRAAYVKQWHDVTVECCTGVGSFALCAWQLLRERILANKIQAGTSSVCAKIMAIMSKFTPFDQSLREAIMRDSDFLWSVLKYVLEALATLPLGVALKSDNTVFETCDSATASASLWELTEHTTTLLAALLSKKFLSTAEHLESPDRISMLLRIVQLGGEKNLVAVGNAALICSFVPLDSCKHYAALSGVDILLESLRGVRTLLFTLESEGKGATSQCGNARAAQKNIAIALSRCCTDESQRERLRVLRGFETLHAVLEQQSN
uniref:Uncharacterized protein n=1 Tax=Trypanosoma congolense (strain IL3000) TaxID=1068625 RepID=G0UWS8_TRYCI|nr:conserved hypothetical protein [Trypanosoma congolense IL3000]